MTPSVIQQALAFSWMALWPQAGQLPSLDFCFLSSALKVLGQIVSEDLQLCVNQPWEICQDGPVFWSTVCIKIGMGLTWLTGCSLPSPSVNQHDSLELSVIMKMFYICAIRAYMHMAIKYLKDGIVTGFMVTGFWCYQGTRFCNFI